MKKAVFLTFYTKDKVFLFKDMRDPSAIEFKKIKGFKFLIFFRHDLRFGFIGGGVEDNENLLESIKREVKEEVPTFYDFVNQKLSKGEYEKVEFQEKIKVIYFLIPVSEEEFDKLLKNFEVTGEINGINVVNVVNFKDARRLFKKRWKEKSLIGFLKNPGIIDKRIIVYLAEKFLSKEDIEILKKELISF